MAHMDRAPRRAAPDAIPVVDVDELEPHELRGWLVALALGANNNALQAANRRARASNAQDFGADSGLSVPER